MYKPGFLPSFPLRMCACIQFVGTNDSDPEAWLSLCFLWPLICQHCCRLKSDLNWFFYLSAAWGSNVLRKIEIVDQWQVYGIHAGWFGYILLLSRSSWVISAYVTTRKGRKMRHFSLLILPGMLSSQVGKGRSCVLGSQVALLSGTHVSQWKCWGTQGSSFS